MSFQTAWVWVGLGDGHSRIAWSGSSQEWQTIQMGPGSEIRRSKRCLWPHSSQVMVTLIAAQSVPPACDAAS